MKKIIFARSCAPLFLVSCEKEATKAVRESRIENPRLVSANANRVTLLPSYDCEFLDMIV